MKRILIIGSGGAGKSTLAKKLMEKLNLPIIHLDCHFWNPGWIKTPSDEWHQMVEEFVAQERWIMDGNYSSTIDVRLERADTVIFLDIPRIICLWRVIKRRIKWHNKVRPDINEGCPESLDWEFIKWIWNYPNRNKPRLLRKIHALNGNINLFILRNSREIEDFMESFEAL